MRYGKQIRFIIREAVDFAGVRLYAFLHDSDSKYRLTHLAKPITVEFAELPNPGECLSLSPLEPTLMLSYETIHRDRVFDQLREGLVHAGLEKDHRGLEGELRASREHIKDLGEISKQLAGKTRCPRCG